MTLRFEVTGENLQELGRNLAQALPLFLPLLKAHQGATPTPPAEAAPVEQAPTVVEATAEEVTVEPKPEKKPRKKAEPKADTESQKVPSIEDVRSKFMALSAAKGHDICWEILKPFGVRKASEIPAERRAEAIAAIDAKMEAAS